MPKWAISSRPTATLELEAAEVVSGAHKRAVAVGGIFAALPPRDDTTGADLSGMIKTICVGLGDYHAQNPAGMNAKGNGARRRAVVAGYLS